ncbi:sensor histidine kinase [Microvirga sp. BSC39]|uniref:sensor histidine kinase n=1 Tax=Microvirga sp. BSC39 TaxID=1549810 RepID=UPI0004E8A24D|nr:sensor histidine kinase [Microvirga sp. BSC39]KFG67585.1 hypothetical protein JH26_21645 [Microvirga sp. BSC39]
MLQFQRAHRVDLTQRAALAKTGSTFPHDALGRQGPSRAEKGACALPALHELATNAAKYGALSNATGEVSLNWMVDHTRTPALLLLR